MAYTTTTIVKTMIPGTYSSTDLSDTHITRHITEADAYINSRLAKVWGFFNDTDDTPATPGAIAQASMYLAAAGSLRQLNTRGDNDGRIQDYEGRALSIIDALSDPESQLAPETVSSETLTFGDGDPAFELGDYQAFIGSGANNPRKATSADPPNVSQQSVTVATATGVTDATQLRNGVDFSVTWNKEWRKWVFEALSSELQTAATSGTVTITYMWDYRRVLGHSRGVSYRMVEA